MQHRFVEPPVATTTVMAFSNASRVRIWRGVIPFLQEVIAAFPELMQTSCARFRHRGTFALPGIDIPNASIADAIVFAVYIPAHEPGPGQAMPSSCLNASAVIFFARMRQRLQTRPES
jgi:hypothetical protein